MTNALIRSSLRDPLLSLDLIDNFFDLLDSGKVYSKTPSFPKCELKHTDDGLIIQFALAGYSKDLLTVEVQEGNTLVVKGDKSTDEENLFARRAFTWKRKDISGVYNLAKTTVKFDNGILTLKVPFKEETKTLQLKVG